MRRCGSLEGFDDFYLSDVSATSDQCRDSYLQTFPLKRLLNLPLERRCRAMKHALVRMDGNYALLRTQGSPLYTQAYGRPRGHPKNRHGRAMRPEIMKTYAGAPPIMLI
jgi:hypothetical protein